MESLIKALAEALERPRDVPNQVVRHIANAHEVDRPAVGAFLSNELSKLEDYEVELVLSPIFTPTLEDQARFAELLEATVVSPSQWPSLVQQLAVRPTVARLRTDDDAVHAVTLREVILERYLHRLRLDGTISEPLLGFVLHLPPASDRPMLKAIARRAVWEPEGRGQILFRYLTTTTTSDTYQLEDAIGLLKLVELYQPTDLPDLLARIPHWEDVLKHELNLAASPKAFFNERVEELHGGGRDQRRQDDSSLSAKERELAFLGRLQRDLGG